MAETEVNAGAGFKAASAAAEDPARPAEDPALAIVASLERAIDAVRDGEWSDDRRRLVAGTDRFAWTQLAPRYDRYFEEVA